jgi:4-amino-4-deoxy-L-arabinose transferase-like glycosyltransferase
MSTTPTQVEPVTNQVAEHRHARLRLLIPAALLIAYVLQCAWFVRTQSLTFDEPAHIFAGLDAWRNHRFQWWNDHPPLGRLLMTAPLLDPKWQIEFTDDEGHVHVTAIRPDPVAMATRARMVNVALGVILGILVWCMARRLFGEGAANFALALFAFSPQMIAHFSVVTTDGIGVLMVFAAVYQLLRWARDPSWRQTALMGVALGLALLSKLYTPPFVLLCLALMLVLRSGRIAWPPKHWAWRRVVTAACIAFVVLWAGYFFHVSHLRVQGGQLTATFPNREPLIKHSQWKTNISLWVPAGEFFDGLRAVKFHNRLGHGSFLLGKVYPKGAPHTYFPIAVALKWPALTLVLALAGIVLVVAGSMRLPRAKKIELAVLSLYAVVAFAMAMAARITIGDRHVLTVYPVLLLYAAAVWEFLRSRKSKGRVAAVALVLLAGLNAGDALRYAPDYLAYFNVFAGRDAGYRLLSDSNSDWGQGLLAVRDYERQHPAERIHLAYFGTVDPQIYGIKTELLRENETAQGAIIIGMTELTGQYLPNPQAFRWLLQYKAKTVLDGCMLVVDEPQQWPPAGQSRGGH